MSTPPPCPPHGSLRLKVVNAYTGANVLVYRLSGGRLIPVVILSPAA